MTEFAAGISAFPLAYVVPPRPAARAFLIAIRPLARLG